MASSNAPNSRPNHVHFLSLELSDEGHQELIHVDRWLADNATFVEQPEMPAFQECQTEGLERAIWAFGEEVAKVIGVAPKIWNVLRPSAPTGGAWMKNASLDPQYVVALRCPQRPFPHVRDEKSSRGFGPGDIIVVGPGRRLCVSSSIEFLIIY